MIVASCTFDSAPIVIRSLSPRSTAPNQTLASCSSATVPITLRGVGHEAARVNAGLAITEFVMHACYFVPSGAAGTGKRETTLPL